MSKVEYSDKRYALERLLEAANDEKGATESRLLFSAFLTFMQVEDYLRRMTEYGLIRYNSANRTYKTTRKGEEFLKSFKELGGLLSFE